MRFFSSEGHVFRGVGSGPGSFWTIADDSQEELDVTPRVNEKPNALFRGEPPNEYGAFLFLVGVNPYDGGRRLKNKVGFNDNLARRKTALNKLLSGKLCECDKHVDIMQQGTTRFHIAGILE